MSQESLSAALEREHREIDHGIAAFLTSPGEAASLARATAALRRHIYLEEDFLFPPLRDGGLSMPIFVMMREHGEVWDTMDELDALVAKGTQDDAVASTGQDLLARLARHNAKEEPVIYPQADHGLTEAATAALRDFMETGQPPQGWVCERGGGDPRV